MTFSLHKGPIGEPEGGLIYQGLWVTDEGGFWKCSVSLYWSSARGTWREGSFTGDPEGHVKEGSGSGHLSPEGPH